MDSSGEMRPFGHFDMNAEIFLRFATGTLGLFSIPHGVLTIDYGDPAQPALHTFFNHPERPVLPPMPLGDALLLPADQYGILTIRPDFPNL